MTDDRDRRSITMTREEMSIPERLAALPAGPGVYQHKDVTGKVLYVGKARNLRSRVRQYFQRSRTVDPRIEKMLERVTDIEVIVTDSEVEALILESNLIKDLKPRYNVVLKDDKSYPYIVVTNEPFPRVFVTRRVIRDGSRYFGPYTDVRNVRVALKAVRDLFMIRSCNYHIDEEVIRRRKVKLCLDYHIKKCGGPCEGLVTAEHYGSMIEQVAGVLEGRTESLIASNTAEMERLAAGMRFEEAAVLRDRIRGLRAYGEKQKAVTPDPVDRDILAFAADGDDACGVIFKVREGKLVGRHNYYMGNVEFRPAAEVLAALVQQHYLGAGTIPPEILLPSPVEAEETVTAWLSERLKAPVVLRIPGEGEEATLVRLAATNARYLLDELKLQRMKRADVLPHALRSLERDLHLAGPPRCIECFDISNIQGSDSVASMVVFVDGKPRRSAYRKFRISSVQGPDDFASMREVVRRRYTRAKNQGDPLPDLIVVDGGKGQLAAAVEVLRDLGLGDQPVIGLAKRLEEVYKPGMVDPELIPRASTGLRLLQQVRDEAHRFAVTFHRDVRAKRTLQTELDLIAGVGKVRARELLEAFGSVQGVRFATTEQVRAVVGEKIAVKIREYFKDETPEQEGGEMTP
jgi:excinuclease ABC subunit C